MAEIIVVEHERPVEADNGIRHLTARGFKIKLLRPYLGDTLPPPADDWAGVIITGGPQFVTDLDRFPYLREEMDFIATIIAANIPLLGVCLGGQLIAAHLGASIEPHADGKAAIGYYPLQITEPGLDWFPQGLNVFACNLQGFSCPADARLLATGNIFPNQAFSFGETTLALQFHPEITRPILDQWQYDVANHIGKAGTQTVHQQDLGYAAYNDQMTAWYRSFLDRFFGSGAGQRK